MLVEDASWVGKKFASLFPDWKIRLAMAANRKIVLDENLSGSPFETELRKLFRKVNTLKSGLSDDEIIKEISKKRVIFVTTNYADFISHCHQNFDLIGVDNRAGAEALADKWAKSIKMTVAGNSLIGNGLFAKKIQLTVRRKRNR